MILSVLFNGLLHETGKRGQDVDGWIDLFVVELPIDEDLPFCDVSSQIGNGVSDVVVLNETSCTGIERIGIWVIEPLRPCTLPALSYIVERSV